MVKEDMAALAEFLAECERDPVKFVKMAFPWGKGELEGETGPDTWQLELLEYIKDNCGDLNKALKIVTSSGHDIGKSAMVSWLILWGMSTMVDCKGVVTANTEVQLRTKTWPELAKWYRMFMGREMFEFTATALLSTDPEHVKTWRIDAVPWSAVNTEAFAGLHNKGKRVMVIFDEASAIDDVIWEVTEGAMTDSGTSLMWLCFGNPTRSTGRFVDNCFGKFSKRWKSFVIDSSKCKISNKKQIAEWKEDYGEDSDFYRVRVRGLPPKADGSSLFSLECVDRSMRTKCEPKEYRDMPVILGVDPAFDGKDFTVVYKRQGIHAEKVYEQQYVDNWSQLASKIMELEDKHNAQAVFIDKGYGTGLYSFGEIAGRKWKMVAFQQSASRKDIYQNKRSEMYYDLKQWMDNGGCIEECQELREELLSTPSFLNAGGKLQIRSKDEIKSQIGGRSPNCADALVLTFAFPVRPDGLKTRLAKYRMQGLIRKAGSM